MNFLQKHGTKLMVGGMALTATGVFFSFQLQAVSEPTTVPTAIALTGFAIYLAGRIGVAKNRRR